MLLGPLRIIRSAGPPDESRAENDAEQRHDHHPERLSFDMRQRAQRYLSGLQSRCVAAPFGNQRMGRFMTCRGEEKYHVLQKSKRKLVGVQEPQYSGPDIRFILR